MSREGARPIRLAYLVSHPIQYQAPLLRRIAAEPGIDLKVLFCSDVSVRAHHDPGFGREIAWDVPLTEGYDHAFLPALGDRSRLSLWRPVNYGLARALRADAYDALWVHGYARWVHIWAMIEAKRLGLKVLLRDEASAVSARRGAIKRLVKHGFFATLRPLVDALLAIGSLNRRYYLDYGFPPERVFAMPYAVDNAMFQRRAAEAAPARDALRAELGLGDGRPVILFASKLIARKRPGDLLAAFAALARDAALGPPHLLFIGDGALGPSLRRDAAHLPAGAVCFLGFRNQTELARYYDLCDVFVLPSEIEPWGLVVNEVMNAARPVIVSDEVGAGADLVRAGENGFVYRAGDVAALAAALRRVLHDPVRRAAMGARSRAIIDGVSFEHDVAGLKAALAQLLGAR